MIYTYHTYQHPCDLDGVDQENERERLNILFIEAAFYTVASTAMSLLQTTGLSRIINLNRAK